LRQVRILQSTSVRCNLAADDSLSLVWFPAWLAVQRQILPLLETKS